MKEDKKSANVLGIDYGENNIGVALGME